MGLKDFEKIFRFAVLDFRAVDFLDFTFRLCLCRFVENLLLTSSLAFARLHSSENPQNDVLFFRLHFAENPLSWILFQHLITYDFSKILYKQILRDKSLRMTEKWYVILSDSEVSNTDDVTQDSSGVALRMTWIVLSY